MDGTTGWVIASATEKGGGLGLVAIIAFVLIALSPKGPKR